MIFEGEEGPDPLSPPSGSALDLVANWKESTSTSEINFFYVVSVAEQTGLVITFPETPNSHIRKDAS